MTLSECVIVFVIEGSTEREHGGLANTPTADSQLFGREPNIVLSISSVTIVTGFRLVESSGRFSWQCAIHNNVLICGSLVLLYMLVSGHGTKSPVMRLRICCGRDDAGKVPQRISVVGNYIVILLHRTLTEAHPRYMCGWPGNAQAQTVQSSGIRTPVPCCFRFRNPSRKQRRNSFRTRQQILTDTGLVQSELPNSAFSVFQNAGIHKDP